MNVRRPSSPAIPPQPGPVFVAPRPDRVPPETLRTAELEHSIRSLQRKLRSAENALFATRLGGAVLAAALLITGFVLLWFGPAPFVERLAGRAIATTYDVFLWWSIVIVACVIGGALGDQMVRGRLRLARGWRHRVDELRHRLDHAETEQARRKAPVQGRAR